MGMVPLPEGIKGLESMPKLQEHLINLMPVEGGVIRTPGIASLTDANEPCRGAVTWLADSKRYQVNGSKLLRIDHTGAVKELGTVDGKTDVVFSQGQVNLVVAVKGGKGYQYSPEDGLREITDPDYLPSDDADFIDGRHVFIPSNGEPAFYSEIDQAGAIEPLSFFDAEELPDRNRCVINVQNQLYIGGEGSFEIFRTNGNPDLVYTKRDGARVDVGFVSGKVRFSGTFAFVGSKRGEGYQIYVMGSGRAQAISNETINEILNEQYTGHEIKQCYAERYEYKGYEVIIFTFPRHTFAFGGGRWFYQDSTLDGKSTPWRAKGISHAYGQYFVGDRLNGNIGILKEIPTEYGQDVEFEIKTYIRSEREANFPVAKFELDCLTGQKITEETIGLSISKDGEIWSDFHYRGLGKTGQYKVKPSWQPAGGIGNFENYCGIRLRSTADVKFSLESLQFK